MVSRDFAKRWLDKLERESNDDDNSDTAAVADNKEQVEPKDKTGEVSPRLHKVSSQPPVAPSRSLAIIGLCSAAYIVSSAIVSYITQLGYPEHLLRGILMTTVVVWSGRKWSATIMGAVCGIVFMLVVPSPAPYLLASTFVSGLVFDLVLMVGSSSYVNSVRSVTRILAGAMTSGVSESIVALAILTYAGFFGAKSFTALSIAWSTDMILNIVLSSIGALIAIRLFLSKRTFRFVST